MFTQASRIQIITAANARAARAGNLMCKDEEIKLVIASEFGKAHKARAESNAPPKRYGRLLPNAEVVLSLKAPIKG